MLNKQNKPLIKNRFGKNLSTYSKNAVVQKHMASELIANLILLGAGGLGNPPYEEDSSRRSGILARQQKNNFAKILEIGCGYGTLTKEIAEKLVLEELFVNDIVENSLNPKISSDKIKELYGDCEKIPFPQDLDLVISNATFQWLENLPEALNKIHSSLNDNGLLAFNTFEEWNLYQIKTLTGKALKYYKKSELEKILSEKFKIIYSNSETIDIEFDSAQDVLKHLKLTGVNALTPTKWTKTDLKEFINKYNNLFKNHKDKLILTYKPVYFICAKI